MGRRQKSLAHQQGFGSSGLLLGEHRQLGPLANRVKFSNLMDGRLFLLRKNFPVHGSKAKQRFLTLLFIRIPSRLKTNKNTQALTFPESLFQCNSGMGTRHSCSQVIQVCPQCSKPLALDRTSILKPNHRPLLASRQEWSRCCAFVRPAYHFCPWSLEKGDHDGERTRTRIGTRMGTRTFPQKKQAPSQWCRVHWSCLSFQPRTLLFYSSWLLQF